ncbi:MAG: His/Gly/Thr/Pro-type tRNA ligase C-terminal domain-containing protein, partial [Bacteroidota bacterium]|nr:His/Gly/Thr/Pro-type tRNA ligase C-terminal domain-containing protein [Bacteroidota bacterium]
PPKLAPIQVVIVPIYKTDEQKVLISEKAIAIQKELKALNISVKYDDRDTQTPGYKFADYELKGVPLRIAIGPRDMENGTVELARRDTKTKSTVNNNELGVIVPQLLAEIQKNIYQKALDFKKANTFEVNTWDEFKDTIKNKGGFVLAHWDGTTETEEKIKDETKATIRCIQLSSKQESGKCIYSGKPSTQKVLFALNY